jgi:hypothetical protein
VHVSVTVAKVKTHLHAAPEAIKRAEDPGLTLISRLQGDEFALARRQIPNVKDRRSVRLAQSFT